MMSTIDRHRRRRIGSATPGTAPIRASALRGPLYRRLAALPVSVAESDLSGRRLVVVRLSAGADVRDLFLDPSTGRFGGAQVIQRGSAAPALSESPNHWPAWPFDSSDTDPVAGEPVEPGEREPGVRDRTLWTRAVVEDIGRRP
jgi:hypothetical protein